MANGKLLIILLIAAILLAASVVVYMKKTQPLEDLTQRYDYLTKLTFSGDNSGHVWSPDGSKIFFIREKQEDKGLSWELWDMNADGSDKQLLLSIPFPYGIIIGDFLWSPDGSKLAFGWAPNQRSFSRGTYLIDVPSTAKEGTS